jgi:hypothetical protein
LKTKKSKIKRKENQKIMLKINNGLMIIETEVQGINMKRALHNLRSKVQRVYGASPSRTLTEIEHDRLLAIRKLINAKKVGQNVDMRYLELEIKKLPEKERDAFIRELTQM